MFSQFWFNHKAKIISGFKTLVIVGVSAGLVAVLQKVDAVDFGQYEEVATVVIAALLKTLSKFSSKL